MGKYEKIRKIGEGAFGEVWEGKNVATGEPVAVKILNRLDPESRKRFAREAKLLLKCGPCEKIVDIIDFFPDREPPEIVMEYCPEGSLETHLQTSGPLRWDVALWLVKEIAEGLVFIHRNNGFHRDVKPGNMLVKRHDEPQWTVKLSDFGVGRDPGLTSTMTYSPQGTLLYMAPELLLGNKPFTASCDIYSLGVSYIHMVSGTPNRDSASVMHFEAAVKVLLDDMLSSTPEQRPTAARVVERIEAIIAEVRASNKQLTPWELSKAQADVAGLLFGGLLIIGIIGFIAALFEEK